MKKIPANSFGLDKDTYLKLKKLNTAKKIQDFLDVFPINMEEKGETYMSVARTLKTREAHCLEGALVAALALWIQGKKPLILDLKSNNGDDHVIALYQENGYWGSISKTNHATLRFRDPVYKTVRELAMSFFHEYIHLKTGEKILESFSNPVDLSDIAGPNMSKVESITDWISGTKELDWLAELLDEVPHNEIYSRKNKKFLRNADPMELKAGNLLEW